MKTNTEKTLFLVALIAAAVNLVLSILYILQLPEQVPTHFDINWVCDGYGSRWIGLGISVLAPLAALSLPLALKMQKHEQNRKPAAIMMLIITGYCIAINWIVMLAFGSKVQLGETYEKPALGWALPLVFSAMFVAMGNYLPILRQNNGLGLRIKWTLENEQCWKLTHRFAGKLWVVTGLLLTVVSIIAAVIGLESGIWILVLLFEMFVVDIAVPCVFAYMHREDA